MSPTFPVGIGIIAVGSVLSAGYTRDIYFGWKSRRWPKTQGRVIEWGMNAGPDLRSFDDSAVIGYEYEVRGVRYTSRRIDYAGSGAGYFGVSRALARYTQGDTVAVSYDPGEPKRSLLEPGIAVGNVLRLLCGLGVIAFGTVFVG